MSDIDVNKIQQNVKELQDQNAIDFQQWKKLGKDIEKLSEKIKLSDTNLKLLMKKIKNDYENLKKIIVDENIQVQLNNKIEKNKNEIVDSKNKIEENKYEINKKVNTETFQNTVDEINSQIDTKASLTINYDNFGEPQNKNEETYTYPNRINFGELKEAPIVKNIPYKGLDIIGHWYNDFGLEYTASGINSSNGSYIWYDWRWNFTTNANYDPQRHPLLGWYKGDDINVLDWQCYWLAESGVNVVNLIQIDGFDNSNWSSSSDKHYWEFQLLNNVKNFKSLKYVLSLKGNSNKYTLEELETQNNKVVDTYKNYRNIYTYNINSKKYACVFVWDTELLRGSLDNYKGYTEINKYYIKLATKMKNIGYDGVCILGRNTNANNNFDYLFENDVVLLCCEYSGVYGDRNNYSNYNDYVTQVPFPTTNTDKTVLNILTSAKSHPAHTSTWNINGSTPKLFSNLVNKAIDHIERYNLPKILTIYNVAEWGEGGASLQPNIYDGFGYLDAIKQIHPLNNEKIEITSIKKETKKEVFAQNTDWIVGKVTGVTLNGGSNGVKTTKEITSLASIFDYSYNVDNYVFFATIQYANDTINNVSCYIYPNFGTKRIYVVVTNNSGADITNVTINVMIRKINIT